MVMGVDIDPRVYMGKSSRSRNFRIKSYEKRYRLTVFATSSRYPGSQESIDEEEYIEAVRLAQDVVRWAEAMILEFP
jgi:hypothetical protein